MQLSEVAKGAWKGKQASQAMHQGQFKQPAQAQQGAAPQQQAPQQAKDPASGLSKEAQAVINIAKQDPSKIPQIIDFLVGVKGSAQHFESHAPILEQATQARKPKDFLAAWGQAGKPTDIGGVTKVLKSMGLSGDQVAQVFKASGINPQDISATHFNKYKLNEPGQGETSPQEMTQLQQTIAKVPRNEKRQLVKILKGMMRGGAKQ